MVTSSCATSYLVFVSAFGLLEKLGRFLSHGMHLVLSYDLDVCIVNKGEKYLFQGECTQFREETFMKGEAYVCIVILGEIFIRGGACMLH